MMAPLIYSLCAILSCGIAVLLWAHFRRTRSRLLYWSALCFTGLTANNVMLVASSPAQTTIAAAMAAPSRKPRPVRV